MKPRALELIIYQSSAVYYGILWYFILYYGNLQFLLGLGDQGSGIEWSTIQIPSRLNLIVHYSTNPIPTTDLSKRQQFFIKIDHF